VTLNKADIVKSVMDNIHLKKRKRERQQFLFPEFDYVISNRKRSTEIVDALFEVIKKTLENGENVLISGFGKFKVKFKWARKGRNPQTGEQIILKSRKIVTFQCSSKLRDKINKTTQV